MAYGNCKLCQIACGDPPAPEDAYCGRCFDEVEGERDALVAALKAAQRAIHSEYCGSFGHTPHCVAATKALKEAGS